MPSVRYYNSSGPFWDFISDLENQGQNHPIFAGMRQDREAGEASGPGFPWSWAPHQFAQAFNPQSAPPYGGPQGAFDEIPDPPSPPAPEEGDETNPMFPPGEKETESGPHRHRGPFGKHHGPHGHHGPRGPCGARGRGGNPFGRRGGGPWGPWGARGGFGGPGGPFNLNAFAQFFQEQFMGKSGNKDATEGDHEDFKPLVDVFDTESAFILHVSLPGAKKEDVAVTWDADKSELSITGVVHRPGDEDFLKTLALDERQVGAFERKVRLGSRANPAQVEVDGITAKLEDGILRIEVPKEDKDYVEVKKVDIE